MPYSLRFHYPIFSLYYVSTSTKGVMIMLGFTTENDSINASIEELKNNPFQGHLFDTLLSSIVNLLNAYGGLSTALLQRNKNTSLDNVISAIRFVISQIPPLFLAPVNAAVYFADKVIDDREIQKYENIVNILPLNDLTPDYAKKIAYLLSIDVLTQYKDKGGSFEVNGFIEDSEETVFTHNQYEKIKELAQITFAHFAMAIQGLAKAELKADLPNEKRKKQFQTFILSKVPYCDDLDSLIIKMVSTQSNKGIFMHSTRELIKKHKIILTQKADLKPENHQIIAFKTNNRIKISYKIDGEVREFVLDEEVSENISKLNFNEKVLSEKGNNALIYNSLRTEIRYQETINFLKNLSVVDKKIIECTNRANKTDLSKIVLNLPAFIKDNLNFIASGQLSHNTEIMKAEILKLKAVIEEKLNNSNTLEPSASPTKLRYANLYDGEIGNKIHEKIDELKDLVSKYEETLNRIEYLKGIGDSDPLFSAMSYGQEDDLVKFYIDMSLPDDATILSARKMKELFYYACIMNHESIVRFLQDITVLTETDKINIRGILPKTSEYAHIRNIIDKNEYLYEHLWVDNTQGEHGANLHFLPNNKKLKTQKNTPAIILDKNELPIAFLIFDSKRNVKEIKIEKTSANIEYLTKIVSSNKHNKPVFLDWTDPVMQDIITCGHTKKTTRQNLQDLFKDYFSPVIFDDYGFENTPDSVRRALALHWGRNNLDRAEYLYNQVSDPLPGTPLETLIEMLNNTKEYFKKGGVYKDREWSIPTKNDGSPARPLKEDGSLGRRINFALTKLHAELNAQLSHASIQHTSKRYDSNQEVNRDFDEYSEDSFSSSDLGNVSSGSNSSSNNCNSLDRRHSASDIHLQKNIINSKRRSNSSNSNCIHNSVEDDTQIINPMGALNLNNPNQVAQMLPTANPVSLPESRSYCPYYVKVGLGVAASVLAVGAVINAVKKKGP